MRFGCAWAVWYGMVRGLYVTLIRAEYEILMFSDTQIVYYASFELKADTWHNMLARGGEWYIHSHSNKMNAIYSRQSNNE